MPENMTGDSVPLSWKVTFGVILALAILIIIYQQSRRPEVSTRPKYESEWHTDVHRGITIALGRNKIRDCGEYAYKRNTDETEDYLVRCRTERAYIKEESGEETTTLFYQVWPNIDSVVGPFSEESLYQIIRHRKFATTQGISFASSRRKS
jgi:hypothetical protein